METSKEAELVEYQRVLPIEVYVPDMTPGNERWISFPMRGHSIRSDMLLKAVHEIEFPGQERAHLRIQWYEENQDGNVVIGEDLFPTRVMIPNGAKVMVYHRGEAYSLYGNLVYPDGPARRRLVPRMAAVEVKASPSFADKVQNSIKVQKRSAEGPEQHRGPSKCEHPDCTFQAHTDLAIGGGRYCCEKCEGLHQGADWAEGGKRHYKNCEKIEFLLA